MSTGMQPEILAVDRQIAEEPEDEIVMRIAIDFDRDDAGRWTARVPLTGCSAEGDTREHALRAVVDLLVANEAADDPEYLTLEEGLAVLRAEAENARGETYTLEEVCCELGIDYAEIQREAREDTP